MVKRVSLALVAFLSLAAMIGFMVVRSGGVGDRESAGGAAAVSVPPELVAVEEAAQVATAPGPGLMVEDLSSAVAELPGLPTIGQPVVKTADISVEIGKDGFAAAFDRASIVAARYGGYVESSSMAGARARSGDLVLRIPSERFDEAMRDIRDLGTVKQEAISGQVVSDRFIDLEARLRTWESQEAVLLDLMGQAKSVESTLRIQRELQDVQFRIEQIKGQLRVLEDQTELATIHVAMRESGAPVVAVRDTGTRPSLAEAWEKAVDGVMGVAYVTVVGLGYLVPLALLGVLVWLAVRRLTRRTEVPATTA
jgi:hypothetical protein